MRFLNTATILLSLTPAILASFFSSQSEPSNPKSTLHDLATHFFDPSSSSTSNTGAGLNTNRQSILQQARDYAATEKDAMSEYYVYVMEQVLAKGDSAGEWFGAERERLEKLASGGEKEERGMKENVLETFESLQSSALHQMDQAHSLASSGIASGQSILGRGYDAGKDAVGSGYGAGQEYASTAASHVGSATGEAKDAGATAVEQATGAAWKGAEEAKSAGEAVGSKASDKGAKSTQNIFGALKNAAGNAAEQVGAAVGYGTDAGAKAVESGKQAVGGAGEKVGGVMEGLAPKDEL